MKDTANTTCAASVRALTTPLNPWRGWDGSNEAGLPAGAKLRVRDLNVDLTGCLDEIDAAERIERALDGSYDRPASVEGDRYLGEGSHAAEAATAASTLGDLFLTDRDFPKTLEAGFRTLDAAEAAEEVGDTQLAIRCLLAAALHFEGWIIDGRGEQSWELQAQAVADHARAMAELLERDALHARSALAEAMQDRAVWGWVGVAALIIVAAKAIGGVA